MGAAIATCSEMLARRSRAATARRTRRRFRDRRQRPGIGVHTPASRTMTRLNRAKPGGRHASNSCQDVPAMRAPLLQPPLP
jgi:hypothetical protein